jgi:hypothetical protein
VDESKNDDAYREKNLRAYNKLAVAEAVQLGVQVCDLHSFIGDKLLPHIKKDGIHYEPPEYELASQFLAAEIQRIAEPTPR